MRTAVPASAVRERRRYTTRASRPTRSRYPSHAEMPGSPGLTAMRPATDATITMHATVRGKRRRQMSGSVTASTVAMIRGFEGS